MTERNSRIVVVGGGISGVSTAYELAKRGHAVTLVEQGDLHAMASGWTLAGVRQSGRHMAELPLAITAVERWQTLGEELGAEIEYRQDGNLRVARSQDEVANIRAVATDGAAVGLPIRYIDDAQEIHDIAPMLRPDVAGASFCATDGHANNALTVRAYAGAAVRLGATVRMNTAVTGIVVENGRVTGVETSNGRLDADVIVLAAGIYTPRLIAPVGLSYPYSIGLCPVIQTEPTTQELKPVLGVAGGTFAGRQEASGSLRLIGDNVSWDLEQHDALNTLPTIQHLTATLAECVRMLPAVADLHVQAYWGGLIDYTPDALPIIDTIDGIDGLVMGTGFSGHGFGIGPVTGEILADLAVGEAPRFDLAQFHYGRFPENGARSPLQMHG